MSSQAISVSSPQISVLVVNWNGKNVLDRCLTALSEQTFKDAEILIIDNASTDGSIDELEVRYPSLTDDFHSFRVIRLQHNMGFAVANNIAARNAAGEWLAVLNNDAFPSPTWLESLVSASGEHPGCASFASRVVREEDAAQIDSAGIIYHSSGLSWNRGQNQLNTTDFDIPCEVFGACGAAALYNREVFLQLNGFDETWGSYYEDTDLAFRLQLSGQRCVYVPDALVEHVGSASFGAASAAAIFHQQRNWVWTYLKNMPTSLLWRSLFQHLLANLVFLFYYLYKGKGIEYFSAKEAALREFSRIIDARQETQNQLLVTNPDPAEVIAKITSLIDNNWLSPYKLGKMYSAIKNKQSGIQNGIG